MTTPTTPPASEGQTPQFGPFPFALTVFERLTDGSIILISSPNGGIESGHSRMVAFDCACNLEQATYITVAVNRHATLAADNKRLRAGLEKAREDVNWMLNNRQFLSPETFNYLDAALSAPETEGRG